MPEYTLTDVDDHYLPYDLETSRLYLKQQFALSICGLHSYPETAIALWFHEYTRYVDMRLRKATHSKRLAYPQLNLVQVDRIQELRGVIGEGKRPKVTTQSRNRHLFWKINLPLLNPYCDICEIPLNLVMHHNHYRKWGHETFTDVSLLCSRCHGLVHTWSFPYNKQYLPHQKSERNRERFGTAEVL